MMTNRATVARKLILLVFLLLAGNAFGAVSDWGVSALVCTVAAIGVDALSLGTATPLLVAAGASIGLHVCGLSLYWQNSNLPPPGGVSRMTVALDNRVTPKVPDGWQDANTPPQQDPANPGAQSFSLVDPGAGTYVHNFAPYVSAQSSVSALAAALTVQVQTRDLGPDYYYEWAAGGSSQLGALYLKRYSNSQYVAPSRYVVDIAASPGCSEHYRVNPSTGQCEYDGGMMKPSDGRCDILKIEGTFQADPGDPDCSVAASGGSGAGTVSGLGSSSIVVAGAQNNSSVSIWGPTGTSGGDFASANSVSVNVYDAETNKTIKTALGTDVYGLVTQFSKYEVGGNTTTDTSSGGGGSSSGNTAFPSDYSRSGEAAAAAGTINAKLDALNHALTDQSAAPSDPDAPDASGYTDLADTFSVLKGWHLPNHASECPTGSFDALGRTYVINAHCSLIQNHWSALQAAMMAVWTIAALFIVLRA